MTIDSDAAPAAEAENPAPSADVEMATEVAAEPAVEAVAAAEPAPAASGEAAKGSEADGKAPVEPTGFDWKALAGDDADALTLLGAFKTPSDLVAKLRADWRDEFADTDKDREWLKRFPDRKAMMKSVNSLRSKVGDQTLVKLPGPKATAEEIADFRRVLGVPEDVKGYKVNLPDGMEQTELDKAILENTVGLLHKAGATQDVLDAAVKAGLAQIEMTKRHAIKRANQRKDESEDVLRSEWIDDFRPNMEASNRFWGEFLADTGETNFLDWELKDGTRIGDHAAIIKAGARMGIEMFGAGAFEDGDPMDATGLDQEIDKLMGHINTPKWSDPKVQQRLHQLHTIKERRNGRAA